MLGEAWMLSVFVLHPLFSFPALFSVFTKHTRIYFVRRPIRREHYNEIQPTASDRRQNINVQAGWANRSWAKVLAEQLCVFHDKELLGKLRLLKMPVTTDERKAMMDNTAMLVALNLRTAGLRVWSKSVMSELPPLNWFGILDEDQIQARRCLARNREEGEMLDEIEEILAADPDRETLKC